MLNSTGDVNIAFRLAYYPDKHLAQPSWTVTNFQATGDLVDYMFRTLVLSGSRVLAANECKLRQSIFVMRTINMRRAFINPLMDYDQGTLVDTDETCITCPGIVTTVPRYDKIVVHAQDAQGNSLATLLEGEEAFLAQHAFDHLSGQMFLHDKGVIKRMIAKQTVKRILKDPQCQLNKPLKRL